MRLLEQLSPLSSLQHPSLSMMSGMLWCSETVVFSTQMQ